MRKLLLCFILGLLMVFPSEISSQTSINNIRQNVPEYVQSISVGIRVPEDGGGSGVVFTRLDSTGTNLVSFIWSAGHLFHKEESLSINIFTLELVRTNPPIVTHAEIYQPISVDGKEQPAGSNILARLIKYSETTSNDIALLQLEKPFFNTNSVIFDLSSVPPKLGEHLYSVSAPGGLAGTFSEGVISFVGRIRQGFIWEQTTCVVYPGSSGGGVFRTNGICIGLVNAMRAPAMNYIVPSRRLHQWAKDENLEWALNPTLPIPTDKEIRSIELRSNR